MRIVSIEKTRRGGRFRLCLDNGKELLLWKEVIVDYGLRRNDEISGEMLSGIQEAQSYQDAYLVAMRLLNYRMRTERELSQRLQKKTFDTKTIKRVIAKLIEIGMIDDSRFAEAFVAGKVALKPIGKRELQRKLRERGVSNEASQKVLSTIGDDETQAALAMRAAELKMPSLRRYDTKKRQEKLIAFLARRGFDWDVIKRVVRKVLDGDIDAVDF